jgi:hypothetical protein
MVPLGHHLRADHNIDGTGLNAADDLAHVHERGHQIGGEQGDAGVWKPFGHLLGDALNPRSAGNEAINIAALWTFLRDRQGETAMVTVEPVPIAMLNQPGGALGTVETVTTGTAQRQRSIAAPVEEQEALLTLS